MIGLDSIGRFVRANSQYVNQALSDCILWWDKGRHPNLAKDNLQKYRGASCTKGILPLQPIVQLVFQTSLTRRLTSNRTPPATDGDLQFIARREVGNPTALLQIETNSGVVCEISADLLMRHQLAA